MNHEEATNRQAVDRYLLGEFSTAERDEYEEHFFECPTCAKEIQTGLALEANARTVFREEEEERETVDEPNRLTSYFGWLLPRFQGGGVVLSRPAFALASLLMVVFVTSLGMQSLGLFREGPVRPTAFYFLKTVRGPEDPPLRFPAGVEQLAVTLRLKDSGYPFYELEFSRPGQRIVEDVANPRNPAQELTVLLSRASFSPGEWTLSVYGLGKKGSDQRTRIDQIRFQIEID